MGSPGGDAVGFPSFSDTDGIGELSVGLPLALLVYGESARNINREREKER